MRGWEGGGGFVFLLFFFLGLFVYLIKSNYIKRK